VSEETPLYCMVEIPKGSRNKYEYDERLGGIRFDRFLFSSVVYPLDYGMFPETLAEDGDPLDAMVAVSEPTFPGCLIPVKPIALFKMRDEKGVDDKVICVPFHDPNWSEVDGMENLTEQLRDEISHFFAVYKTLEQKDVEVDGWYSREDALRVIEEAKERWKERSA
jgi:inorganic pyrophosphatase